MVVKLLTRDKQGIQKELASKLAISNFLALPCIKKVVINVSHREFKDNPKFLENIVQELKLISGQKPIVRKARQSIAGFKIRKGDPVGLMVTLRGKKMADFLFRLFNIVLPRVRDFKGLSSKRFDKEGNYTLGLKEQTVFPEIPYDKIVKLHGLEITLQIKNSDPQKSQVFLETLGVPILKT